MSQPLLTPDEFDDARGEVWAAPWNDPALFPSCLVYAFDVLGDLALNSGDADARHKASQAIRRMVYRAKNGELQHEVDIHD